MATALSFLEGLTLSLPGDPTKRFEAHCDGNTLVCSTWTAPKPPRVTRKELSSESMAKKELDKAIFRKRKEGFVYLPDSTPTQWGGLLFAANLGPFDVDLTGKRLFGSITSENDLNLITLELTLGGNFRRDEIAIPQSLDNFIHAMAVGADGERGFYYMTRCLDQSSRHFALVEHHLETGIARNLLSHQRTSDVNFNPFSVKPQLDAARQRLLMISADNTLDVLDVRNGQPLCSLTPPLLPCRKIALSPSGELVAALLGEHQDNNCLSPNEVCIWNVSNGELAQRFAIPEICYMPSLGFSPDDHTVMLTVGRPCGPGHLGRAYGQGPMGYSVLDGTQVFDLSKRKNDNWWHARRCWAFSPNGRCLALGNSKNSDEIELYNATDFTQIGAIPTQSRNLDKLVFAADGQRLFAGGEGLVEGWFLGTTGS